MNGKWFEILIGALVIVVAGAFLAYAYTRADTRPVHGYDLTARFDRVDGIRAGTDVRISGIKVGTVTSTVLDGHTYQAVVSISVLPDVKIPANSSLKVASEGLLGSSYLSIEPGGADDMLKSGGQIRYTQGSVDLIGLVSKAMFGSGSGDAKAGAAPKGEGAR